jgi:hypothetical protein
LESVAAFFRENFEYSLKLNRPEGKITPIESFLHNSRSGHCEYFATATVLLLRAAGIPARYGTGYLVQEFSSLENRFVVRARHAHAWALVYLDGAWRDFDTTPSAWIDIEQEGASIWEPVYDLISWAMFSISEWRWSEREGGMTKHVWWLFVLLALILGRRLYSRKRVRRSKEDLRQRVGIESNPGSDSEFYLIEKRLIEWGHVRYSWETLSGWIGRLEKLTASSVSADALRPLLSLHYRYRFDPNGITVAERAALKSGVHSWLEQKEKEGNGGA